MLLLDRVTTSLFLIVSYCSCNEADKLELVDLIITHSRLIFNLKELISILYKENNQIEPKEKCYRHFVLSRFRITNTENYISISQVYSYTCQLMFPKKDL